MIFLSSKVMRVVTNFMFHWQVTLNFRIYKYLKQQLTPKCFGMPKTNESCISTNKVSNLSVLFSQLLPWLKFGLIGFVLIFRYFLWSDESQVPISVHRLCSGGCTELVGAAPARRRAQDKRMFGGPFQPRPFQDSVTHPTIKPCSDIYPGNPC